MPKEIFTQKLEGSRRRGRPGKSWKEEVERDLQVLAVRRWRELVADGKKMEGRCSTGQSPLWAVVPLEEEEEAACRQHRRCFLPQAVKQSSAPEDGRNYRPKHVELIEIINKIIIVASSWLFMLLYQ